MGGGEKAVLTLLDNRDQSLFTTGSVINKPLPCIGPCWSLSGQLPFPPLPRTCILVYVCIYTHLYVQAKEFFSNSISSISLECPVPLPHSPDIEILMFTPESPGLLMIPPNQ